MSDLSDRSTADPISPVELPPPGAPSQIGPYRILAVVGEGGMGIIYKAEQRSPVRRTVALKLIKLGMDTRAVIARFEAERQALALMDHPNIARVFEAGADDRGRPYFVMEFVAGESITSYCDKQKLTIGQRLQLFVQACEAVQHAHMKGIIHRDIKPSNILVSILDQKPVVKVIDFGVAKATAQRLTERTMFTEMGQMIGTPEYMSPEQAEMSGLDVDTRSDIYSLGVVLYQLLAGVLPFDSKMLREAGYEQVCRIIREQDPPTPSTRLRALPDSAAQIAQARQTEPPTLAALLRRELEWIPLKAMREDRTHRYRTASEMADDVRNYLNGRPLIAGPESTWYRARKFLTRNKAPVAAAALIAVALAGGTIGTSIGLLRARRAEVLARAEQAKTAAALAEAESANANSRAVIAFLTDDILGSAHPGMAQGRTPSVQDAVNAAADAVATKFADRPLVEGAMRDTLATIYIALGRPDLAVPHAQTALERYRNLLGNDDPRTLGLVQNLAYILRMQGKYADAEPLYREALEGRRRILGDDHPDTLRSLSGMAELKMSQGKFADAEMLQRDVLARRRRLLGSDHPDTIESLNNLGSLLQGQGNLDEAETLLREVMERIPRVLGEGHPHTIIAMLNVGNLLIAKGELAQAESLYRAGLERSRRVLGEDHRDTLGAMDGVGMVLQKQGKLTEAEPWFRDAMARRRRTLGDDHPDTLDSINNVAYLLHVQGRYADAEPLFREALQRIRKTLGNNHRHTLQSIDNLAATLERQGKLNEAEPLYAELYQRIPNAQMDPRQAAAFISKYGLLLNKLGRHDEALPPLTESLAQMQQTRDMPFASIRRVFNGLIIACERTHRADDASKWRAALATAEATTRAATAPATQPAR